MTTVREAPRGDAGSRAPVPCRICGAAGVAPAFPFREYTVMRCGACTGEFLDPQPTDAALAAIYTADYFIHAATPEEHARFAALKRATARHAFAALAASGASLQGRLLEIGPGLGDFLAEAEASGLATTGIEFSPTSAAAIVGRIRGTVITGTLESAELPDASFDIVANSDVIEHVREPLVFAREMRRVLRPGGTALVVTPSLDTWSRKLMGRSWAEYKVEHLFYFNRRSITMLLREAGFTDVTVGPNVKSLSIDYIAGHFEKFPVPLWSPLVRGVRRVLPGGLAHRPLQIPSSGMTVIAR